MGIINWWVHDTEESETRRPAERVWDSAPLLSLSLSLTGEETTR